MSAEAAGYSINWTTTDKSVHDISLDLKFHKNSPFSTFDRISKGQKHCMAFYKGGWWYARCLKIFQNGAYIPKEQFSRTSIYSNQCKDKANLQTSCMMVRPKGDNIPCNNQCKNNGICGYVAATKRYVCKCPSDFCGAICETAKPCKVGTCEYSTTTKTNTGKCVDDSDSDDSDSSSALVFGVIIGLFILIAALVVGSAFFLNRRKRRQEEERAAERQRLLDEQAKLVGEVAGYLSFMGF